MFGVVEVFSWCRLWKIHYVAGISFWCVWQLLVAGGGMYVEVFNRGVIPLAYSIRKKNKAGETNTYLDGIYLLFTYFTKPESIVPLETVLTADDDIIRSSSFKIKKRKYNWRPWTLCMWEKCQILFLFLCKNKSKSIFFVSFFVHCSAFLCNCEKLLKLSLRSILVCIFIKRF